MFRSYAYSEFDKAVKALAKTFGVSQSDAHRFMMEALFKMIKLPIDIATVIHSNHSFFTWSEPRCGYYLKPVNQAFNTQLIKYLGCHSDMNKGYDNCYITQQTMSCVIIPSLLAYLERARTTETAFFQYYHERAARDNYQAALIDSQNFQTALKDLKTKLEPFIQQIIHQPDNAFYDEVKSEMATLSVITTYLIDNAHQRIQTLSNLTNKFKGIEESLNNTLSWLMRSEKPALGILKKDISEVLRSLGHCRNTLDKWMEHQYGDAHESAICEANQDVNWPRAKL